MASLRRFAFALGTVVAIAGVLVGQTVGLARTSVAWPQWAQNPQHTNQAVTAGQALTRILADIVYDPLVPQERAAQGGDLLVHYQAPLVDADNNVYMESKSGNYQVSTYSTQIWSENKFSWQSGKLVQVWSFRSDWYPPGSPNDFWEPVYHATLANGSVYTPGKGGTIVRLNPADGSMITRINPFKTIDPLTYTVSPITADDAGNLYYNVLRLPDAGPFYDHDAVDSWLVKVAPDNSLKIASYTGLNTIAKSATDLCLNIFSSTQLPWPPSQDAVPPSLTCGLQRVALNIAPAIAPDGSIYSITRHHFRVGSRHAYIVAINPDLTPKWASSMRGLFNDGCNDGSAEVLAAGTILPRNGAPGGCREGANPGVDPAQNAPGGARVLDDSSSTPTVAPDGSVIYGAYTRYNYAQGHLVRFSANGELLGYFPFGWDTTVGIFQHGGTYSIVEKNNHYSGLGSYCNNATFCPTDRTATNAASPEAFFVSQLSPTTSTTTPMPIEWSFQNTNTQSCSRNPDGSLSCVSDHPHSFEWCVNAPAIDTRGVVYANSEDGNLYAIAQGGTVRDKIFQQLAVGAAYTPATIGPDGKIYSQNAGHLFVVGQ